ncbi:hypothetical protein [Lactococcus fujiensis]|uniref:hypothetical protein n=1 Tax=Lactococcus fujiensis TaxID=610251 RepID=UPI0006D2600E|nr:hypothetical protein [Lactococcus fujiensis]
MTEKQFPWENPEQNYNRTLAKRRSERRYRTRQLAKTLRVSLSRLKALGIRDYNSEIVERIETLERDADFIDDIDFFVAKSV